MSSFFNLFNSPPQAPSLQQYTPPSLTSTLSQFLGQGSQLPQLQQFATQANQLSNNAYQQSLYGSSPTLQGNLNQFGNNTQSLLQGQIPADVQAQIANSSAYQALRGGYGPSSGLANSNQARNLGLTSLQLQQQGAGNLQQQLGQTQQLNPSNVMSSQLFYSPQTVLSRADQSALINNQIANQNQQIGFQNQLTQAQGSPFQQFLNNSLGSLIQNGGNTLTNGFGSGFGQSGGGNSFWSGSSGNNFGGGSSFIEQLLGLTNKALPLAAMA